MTCEHRARLDTYSTSRRNMVSIPSQGYKNIVAAGTGEGGVRVEKTLRSNTKLLQRFYEPLHLLCILNADRGPGEVDLPPAPRSRDFKMTWRRFLDDLLWLCDNRHGGETVSAVAAQSLPEGNKFWLVSNHEASRHHLEWVLTKLTAVQGETNEGMSAVASCIAAESIFFSRDKVNNYAKHLKLALGKAKKMRPTPENIGSVDGDEYGWQSFESTVT